MEFIYEENRIYRQDANGKLIAEVTFPALSESVVNIEHTFVDDSLRGQGIASQLVKAAAEKLRQENKKALVTCPYAEKWFRKNTDYADVLYQANEKYF